MKRETIGIIGGTGEFGAAFAEYFREQGHRVLIAGRKTALSIEEASAISDIVILSVPISAMEAVTKQVASNMRPESLLMDFCSVKEEPLQLMLQYFGGEVIGCHPMFGPRNLLPGQTVVLCEGRGTKWLERIKEIFCRFEIVEMQAAQHDRAMALVQGVQHFMENAYAKTVADLGIPIETLLSVSSPVYRIQMGLVARILSQDEKLYGEICYGSPHTRKAIAKFREAVDLLSESGRDIFETEFLQGRVFFGDYCRQSQLETDKIIEQMAMRNKSELSPSPIVEQRADIGTLGPSLTWSDLAASHFFPGKQRQLYPNFPAIIAALETGTIERAFLPLENKISGTVRANWDAIAEGNLWIEAVYDFPISHVLAANTATCPRMIFGHSEALAQCRKSLEQEYPDSITIPVASNSEALARARADTGSAAICSPQAAKAADFIVLQESIADKPGNWTRFGLISRSKTLSVPSDHRLTSLFFELKNVPGALLEALKIFSSAGKNLLRLESRPCGNLSEFGFFTEVEGTVEESVLSGLQKITRHLKVLGEYEVGALPSPP